MDVATHISPGMNISVLQATKRERYDEGVMSGRGNKEFLVYWFYEHLSRIDNYGDIVRLPNSIAVHIFLGTMR